MPSSMMMAMLVPIRVIRIPPSSHVVVITHTCGSDVRDLSRDFISVSKTVRFGSLLFTIGTKLKVFIILLCLVVYVYICNTNTIRTLTTHNRFPYTSPPGNFSSIRKNNVLYTYINLKYIYINLLQVLFSCYLCSLNYKTS